MSARSASRWVVVKFGGTSVSTLVNWRNIALVVKRRLESGARVLVVHSAITKITDMLEKLLAAAISGNPDEPLKAIEDRHRQLTTELGVGVSAQLQGYFDELRQMANGIALVRELSDKTRARVMANGELMATEIGSRFLKSQGIDVTWMDARDMLSRRRSRRLRQGFGAVGHLFVRARCRARAAARRLDAGGDHPGLHRARQRRQHLPAGSRRLRYLGGLPRREDPREGRSKSGPTCPACSARIRARRRPRG